MIESLSLFCAITVLITYTWRRKLISLSALVSAVPVAALMLYNGFFWILALILLFLLAVLATRYKREEKRAFLVEQKKRTWKNVFGNGAVPALFALLYAVSPSDIFFIGFMAAVAASLADTLASELGPVLGRGRVVDVMTGRQVHVGHNGGVSSSGLLASLGGSAVIAGLLVPSGFPSFMPLVLGAGFAGSLVDSVLGTLCENRGYFDGNVTNFLGTLIASLIAIALYFPIP